MRLRSSRPLLFGLAAIGLVGAGWWAGSVAMKAPADPLADRQPIAYTVAVDTVGRSFRFSTSASWPLHDLGRNSAEGVVTSIDIDPGQLVGSGDLLYSVNLRPVIVAEGSVPAFRNMALRDEGRDVAQLQGLLVAKGFYEGEADGVFDSETRAAVRRWQSAQGVSVDGVVRAGDVVFVEQLPARVVLDPEVVVGSRLTGGEPVLRQVGEDAEFVIVLAGGQGSLVPPGSTVIVTHDDLAWDAQVVAIEERSVSGEFILHLAAVDGGPVCGNDCIDAVPITQQTIFPAEVVVVPEVTGPAVPVAALMTRPDGSVVVRMADGRELDVTIVASSGGMAVIEGLRPGDEVLLPVES